jgi:hypothetical protein
MAGGYNPAPSTGQIVTVAEALSKRLAGGGAEVDVVIDTSDAAGVAAAANASKGADLAIVVVGDTAVRTPHSPPTRTPPPGLVGWWWALWG